MNNLKAFEFKIVNGVGHITFNQSFRGNPIDAVFCAEFKQLAIECDENQAVRSVLIDSFGQYFSVGGDIKAMLENKASLPAMVKSSGSDFNSAISRLARMDAPVVVAAHALVAGGTNALIAAADFALAAKSSKFYAAFCSIGFSCDCGSSYFMPRRVGSRKSTEFYLLNQTWTAEQALENGLINTIFPDEELSTEAIILAEELASGATIAYGEIKRLLLSSYDKPLEMQLEDEISALARCSKTEDNRNGLTAMVNKEDVIFSGN